MLYYYDKEQIAQARKMDLQRISRKKRKQRKTKKTKKNNRGVERYKDINSFYDYYRQIVSKNI